jgi:putative Holliday junction resolvase
MTAPTLLRALGIDHGTVRIGVAVSDEIGFLAHPLETVPGGDTERAIERLNELVTVRRIDHVVVGLPLHLDGREGEAAKRVRAFITKLRARLPDSVPIHEIDETLTTSIAYEKLGAAGKKHRQAKPVIDQAAAVEILQSWLDARAGE